MTLVEKSLDRMLMEIEATSGECYLWSPRTFPQTDGGYRHPDSMDIEIERILCEMSPEWNNPWAQGMSSPWPHIHQSLKYAMIESLYAHNDDPHQKMTISIYQGDKGYAIRIKPSSTRTKKFPAEYKEFSEFFRRSVTHFTGFEASFDPDTSEFALQVKIK